MGEPVVGRSDGDPGLAVGTPGLVALLVLVVVRLGHDGDPLVAVVPGEVGEPAAFSEFVAVSGCFLAAVGQEVGEGGVGFVLVEVLEDLPVPQQVPQLRFQRGGVGCLHHRGLWCGCASAVPHDQRLEFTEATECFEDREVVLRRGGRGQLNSVAAVVGEELQDVGPLEPGVPAGLVLGRSELVGCGVVEADQWPVAP